MTTSLFALALGASPLTVGVLMALFAALPMLLSVYAGRLHRPRGARRPLLARGVGARCRDRGAAVRLAAAAGRSSSRRR